MSFQAVQLRRERNMGSHCLLSLDIAERGTSICFSCCVIQELARTAARIAFTFIPVILVKNHRTRKILKHVEDAKKKDPNAVFPARFDKLVENKGDVLRRIRKRTILFHGLLFTPIFLFWAAIVASLERTPLTGRWRLILLSPEEEQDISSQLAGSGWYQAVGEIIAKDGPPKIIPPSDWRYAWVRDTLRALETAIPTLGIEQALEPAWLERGPDDVPLPPPAKFPLRPRPRASEYIHWVCQVTNSRPVSSIPHIIPGPPYSLIVVDNPDSCNAFSYGFGPDGAGGIVVFSGFLDQIMRNHPPLKPTIASNVPRSEETSWWSHLFGNLFVVTPPINQYQPTSEQTSDLAILLAHELAHLVLSHHLETLSSRTVVVPGILSIFSDVVRTLIFPITMFLGPFVNDAVGQLGTVGSGELTKLGEYCTSQKQEIEADVVSARLLAHAGFDPRRAVQFWQNRSETPATAECSPTLAKEKEKTDKKHSMFPLGIMGSGHPMNEVRVAKLRGEIERWQEERIRVRAERQLGTVGP
ncbi:Metallo peptidase M48 [Heterobasidion irregulare TC 32-1]|uniref:Metallo peptidase M48 n=1 Tax=Heterobasidion irregulare (strain TC 32-1) TaxID=747525 RepID=W4KD69_HETIT|nr:Metallo peptidase M48 [Heterobasidion irregulare TC 32-1]ETW83031.1 Metallo peptidase M48 [Heterobasidion irregulare TC 32-1]